VLLEATTPERSVTIAGDSAQRLVFDNAFTDWASFLRAAGHEALALEPLRLSYRSTAQVMRFARAVLGPLADPAEPLWARDGEPVTLYRFDEAGEAVLLLAEALRALHGREPTASVAVIARHPEQADQWHQALARAEVPALRRVRRHDFAFAPGVGHTIAAGAARSGRGRNVKKRRSARLLGAPTWHGRRSTRGSGRTARPPR
jgi:DNA helicase-2/ATP-dependent DNA helicase PcrA